MWVIKFTPCHWTKCSGNRLDLMSIGNHRRIGCQPPVQALFPCGRRRRRMWPSYPGPNWFDLKRKKYIFFLLRLYFAWNNIRSRTVTKFKMTKLDIGGDEALNYFRNNSHQTIVFNLFTEKYFISKFIPNFVILNFKLPKHFQT